MDFVRTLARSLSFSLVDKHGETPLSRARSCARARRHHLFSPRLTASFPQPKQINEIKDFLLTARRKVRGMGGQDMGWSVSAFAHVRESPPCAQQDAKSVKIKKSNGVTKFKVN